MGYLADRKAGRVLGPEGRHYPNKAERQLLVRMQQASGQTEAQVRASLSNRRKLAAARASMSQPKPVK